MNLNDNPSDSNVAVLSGRPYHSRMLDGRGSAQM